MGFWKSLLKKVSFNETNMDIENHPWIRISIDGFCQSSQKEKYIGLYGAYADKLSWKLYVEEIDSSSIKMFDAKGNKINFKQGDYFGIGILPQNGGISPKELSLNLLTFRKVALHLFNPQLFDVNKSKKETKITTDRFHWSINKSEDNHLFFVVLKNGMEISANLRAVIILERKNPKLSKKAFYFSIREIYNNQKKVSQDKKEEPNEREKAKKVIQTLEEAGYNSLEKGA